MLSIKETIENKKERMEYNWIKDYLINMISDLGINSRCEDLLMEAISWSDTLADYIKTIELIRDEEVADMKYSCDTAYDYIEELGMGVEHLSDWYNRVYIPFKEEYILDIAEDTVEGLKSYIDSVVYDITEKDDMPAGWDKLKYEFAVYTYNRLTGKDVKVMHREFVVDYMPF